jgi:cysteinyl-tRNA synthetase
MQLFNTLTNQLDEIKPGPDNVVTLYSCGPTVYDHAHIGNMRTFVMDDLLRRSLRAAGYTVRAVMNITDIDDKTIVRSQEEYPDLGPMEALIESTRKYEDIFKEDLRQVGVDLDLVTFVRATDSIPQMQRLIQSIYDNGYAYVADGSVYFDLKKFRADGKPYGRLTNVDYSAQARVDNDEYEKNEARDFALWKGVKDGEPYWDFSLNEHDVPGRPGWHIECSAMALDNLGQPLTIHSGGIDLKFPHHENEIAQVVAATDQDFTELFTHHNHLYVDGRKMSKSLNNFYTIEDIKAKGFHPLAFRLVALQANHTSQLNFTWESIEAAQNRLGNLYAWADLSLQSSAEKLNKIANLEELLANDLASPLALEAIAEHASVAPAASVLEQIDAVFGLGLANRPNITADQKQLITQRQTAREAKDWAASDKLRDQLAEQGLDIDDTPNGPIWRRTNL